MCTAALTCRTGLTRAQLVPPHPEESRLQRRAVVSGQAPSRHKTLPDEDPSKSKRVWNSLAGHRAAGAYCDHLTLVEVTLYLRNRTADTPQPIAHLSFFGGSVEGERVGVFGAVEAALRICHVPQHVAQHTPCHLRIVFVTGNLPRINIRYNYLARVLA